MSDTTSMETEPSLRYFRNLVCLPLLQGTKNVQKACRQTLVTRNRKLARSVPRQPKLYERIHEAILANRTLSDAQRRVRLP